MLKQWIQESASTVVFTGAGMSTESGLPDFRSSMQGIWKDKDPMQLASTDAMIHNREEFVHFYRMRIEGLLQAKPHVGHEILEDGTAVWRHYTKCGRVSSARGEHACCAAAWYAAHGSLLGLRETLSRGEVFAGRWHHLSMWRFCQAIRCLVRGVIAR